MSSYEEKQNRQLLAMLIPAQERLKKYTIEELCERAAIAFDESTSEFLIMSLGRTVHVRFPEFEIREKLDMWHTLTLLQYMSTAEGSELSGNLIGLSQMRGGLARGVGFDKDITVMFARYFSNTKAEEFRRACRKLGGRIEESKADVSAIIPYAPRFPIMVNFWEADEDFPASGKVLVDEKAECYLEIEAAGGACAAVIQYIAKELGTYV